MAVVLAENGTRGGEAGYVCGAAKCTIQTVILLLFVLLHRVDGQMMGGQTAFHESRPERGREEVQSSAGSWTARATVAGQKEGVPWWQIYWQAKETRRFRSQAVVGSEAANMAVGVEGPLVPEDAC